MRNEVLDGIEVIKKQHRTEKKGNHSGFGSINLGLKKFSMHFYSRNKGLKSFDI